MYGASVEVAPPANYTMEVIVFVRRPNIPCRTHRSQLDLESSRRLVCQVRTAIVKGPGRRMVESRLPHDGSVVTRMRAGHNGPPWTRHAQPQQSGFSTRQRISELISVVKADGSWSRKALRQGLGPQGSGLDPGPMRLSCP